MSVAIADAFRYVATSGTNAGEVDGTLTAPGVGGTLTIVGGFGITLTADTANRKITITNTGNGTGALTTITSQNSGTYYPVFTSIPGTFNPATGTYTSSTLYYESTTTPLSYNTTTGTLNVNSLVLGGAGTFSLDGVTSTGVTGTGNVVFGTSPTLVTPTLGAALATSINGLAITSSTGTFTLTNLKTFAVQNTITLAGTDSTTITLPATTGTVALNNQTFFLGSTSIAINRATASQSLTGITSIDGYAAGIAGGAIGYIPYQSVANTTLFVTGNTTTTPQFLTSTGTGSAAQAPTLTSSTGTGSVVLATSPSLTTPTLGVASATSINKMAITAPGTSSTLAVADGKTFTVNNTITLAGTDSTTITLPATTGTVALNNQTMYIGSTSIAINRATASQSLTGITSIDGYAAGIAGGAIGYIPYQSVANTTLFVTGNTTTTPQFLTSTGTGSAAQAPTLTSSTGTGSVVLATSPSLTTPTLGVASATSINKMAITAPGTSSTLAVADGKTFTVNNTITLAGTDSTTITLPATTGTVALNNQTMFIGSTSIAINRATASQSLTGITSIDGYSAGLAGGNATTLLGSLPYQSAANTTTLLGPNTTTTKKFLRQTGDGTNGAVPAWDTVTATDVGLSNVTNESKATMFTSPTFTGTVTMQQSVELFTSPSISANAVTLNFNNGAIFALGSNAANITANFTNIPGTAGQTISTTLIITQGATAYIPSAITINGGGSVTPKWQGGSAPSGTANRVDIVSFTFVCTATNTWTTIGSLTDYN